MDTSRTWRLTEYPEDALTEQHLSYAEEPIPEVKQGQIRARVLYISIDPANRLWIRPEGSYLPPFPLGCVMPAVCIAVVEDSRHPRYAIGDFVQGIWGWQEVIVADAGPPDEQLPLDQGGILPLPLPPPGVQLRDYFGPIGIHGLTAYFGITDVGKANAGDTVLVSAAAGAIGSLATQIARNLGCRVIGIAGSTEKCRKVVEEYGADACINYKSEDIAARLRELAPEGIDVYFDNVGGHILEGAIDAMAKYGRIVFCGAISQYNDEQPRGPSNYMTLLYKELHLQGFLALSYVDRMAEAVGAIAGWMGEGRLHMELDVRHGIENCLSTFSVLFDGSNKGKLIQQIAEES